MTRITFQELQDKIDQADKVSTADHSKSNTRHGSYVTITKGLTVSTWFYGLDTTNNQMVVELVG